MFRPFTSQQLRYNRHTETVFLRALTILVCLQRCGNNSV